MHITSATTLPAFKIKAYSVKIQTRLGERQVNHLSVFSFKGHFLLRGEFSVLGTERHCRQTCWPTSLPHHIASRGIHCLCLILDILLSIVGLYVWKYLLLVFSWHRKDKKTCMEHQTFRCGNCLYLHVCKIEMSWKTCVSSLVFSLMKPEYMYIYFWLP